ncbi:glutathione S-transferase family protein [Brevundimonas aveniformis]|uniref:glutathione S-transferase family protein n=1 Tax=Brevundimonas aveniformis TaxID=370977 RepID=UPI002491B44B|nr:glutathione S-transferase family protein [Brevundimonas aveniformis]
MRLYTHPFSSYCQKALIAFYENDIPFEERFLEDPGVMDELASRWPMKRFPLLVDGDRTVMEATAIIEYLAALYPGPIQLIPHDPILAVETRMMDRVFDNYVNRPQQDIIFEAIRPQGANPDPFGVSRAREMLETSYAWLNYRMAGREWAVGGGFSLADCAAAPALFYADWTHEIPANLSHLIAYRQRLLARPSFARCVEAARRFRPYFPLGAPDRD